MPTSNDPRVALVTGGTRGIGFGIATALAQAGLTLVITGRRPESDVLDALEGLRALAPATYLAADVAKARDRAQLLETIESSLGRLDLLVNNAGIAPPVRADILEASEASFDQLIATNLKGPYFLTQAVANWMIRQPPAHRTIINISSISATVASVNRGDYCISKAGIAMATRLWAVRLAEFGINVYEVQPGIIQTDMTDGVKAKYDAMIANGLLLEPRWGTPADVGTAVAMLASGALPYASGSVLVLDGGLTLPRL
jgi:NAD(P)-dependent dehydrogenase (short-subunit alcohol dehydrogenase family)